MFQRAMLLAVVFVLSVSDSSSPIKCHLLLRATTYMKGNHGFTRTWKKGGENWSPCFCNI